MKCPKCGSKRVIRNGKKAYKVQNYLCKDCGKQFISDADRTYKGTVSGIRDSIKRALVRGSGIRDAAFIFAVSIGFVLRVLVESCYGLKPKKKHYERLEVDEFWTFVGTKSRRFWLIYAYDRESGEMVAWVWGNRSAKTAQRLRERLVELGVTYGRLAMDDWDSFAKAFSEDPRDTGKEHTVGIEGNNCRLRHRMRRVFRKTCNFSKKILNHVKAFRMTAYYINTGYV